ncbi:MAG: hypothetical protein ABSE73_10405 [Planctomycetota bacterium]
MGPVDIIKVLKAMNPEQIGSVISLLVIAVGGTWAVAAYFFRHSLSTKDDLIKLREAEIQQLKEQRDKPVEQMRISLRNVVNFFDPNLVGNDMTLSERFKDVSLTPEEKKMLTEAWTACQWPMVEGGLKTHDELVH